MGGQRIGVGRDHGHLWLSRGSWNDISCTCTWLSLTTTCHSGISRAGSLILHIVVIGRGFIHHSLDWVNRT